MTERRAPLLWARMLGLSLWTGVATAAPLEEGALIDVLDGRQPAVQMVAAELDRAAGQALGAAGTFDLKIKSKADSAIAGAYDWAAVEVAAEQQLPAYGALLSVGWRTGQGELPIYYLDKQTTEGGELFMGLVLPILEGGRTDAGRTSIGVAAEEQRAAQARARIVQIELQAAARTAYWSWVASVAKLRVAEELLVVAESRASAIQARIDGGDLPPLAALDNRRAVLERAAEVANLRQKVRQSAVKLSLYWRDPTGAPLPPDDADAPGSPAPPTPEHEPVEALLAEAEQRRPEINELDALVKQIDAQLLLAKTERAPSLDLVGRAAQDLGEGDAKLQKPELVVGLRLESPVQLRKARGKIDELEAKRASLVAKQRLARDKIRAEVLSAMATVEATAAAYRFAQEGAAAATQLADGERARFSAGDTELLTVYLREQSSAKAAGDRVDALATWHSALAELDAAVGRCAASPLAAP